MTKYWIILHGADTTETGLMMHRSYIKTIWKGFPAQQCCEKEIIEDFCRGQYGKKVDYVQGVAPCINWSVKESDETEYNNQSPTILGGWKTNTHVMVAEIGSCGKFNLISDVVLKGGRV